MIVISPDVHLARGTLRRRELRQFVRDAAAAVSLRGALSVLFTTDAEIRELNRRFRRKNKSTDVLSFPAAEGGGLAGDLAVSLETAARQAHEHGHTLEEEVRILLLHGILHLAGLDHERDVGEMLAREGELRARFGLSAGLIERSEALAR